MELRFEKEKNQRLAARVKKLELVVKISDQTYDHFPKDMQKMTIDTESDRKMSLPSAASFSSGDQPRVKNPKYRKPPSEMPSFWWMKKGSVRDTEEFLLV